MPNEGTLRVKLFDVDAGDAIAPDTAITVSRVGDGRVIRRFKLSFPPAHDLRLPAFPDEKALVVFVSPPRYRARFLPPFFLANGDTFDPDITLMRLPNAWTARFEAWNSLPDHFARLKRALNASADIQVIKGAGALPRLADHDYDNLDVSKPIHAESKACMLNLFAKLSELKEPVHRRRSWFSFVQRILRIGRERMVAVVEETMAKRVRQIKEDISLFPDYKRTPVGDHWKNLPPAFQVAKTKMFSVKTKEDHGNVQLTLGQGTDPVTGKTVWLLDTDIDENGKLMAHVADLFKHKFTGGTHPYDIHEYVRLEYPALELGYRLT